MVTPSCSNNTSLCHVLLGPQDQEKSSTGSHFAVAVQSRYPLGLVPVTQVPMPQVSMQQVPMPQVPMPQVLIPQVSRPKKFVYCNSIQLNLCGPRHWAVTVQSLYSHSAVTVQSLCSYKAVSKQWLCSHLAVIMQSQAVTTQQASRQHGVVSLKQGVL